MNQRRVGLALVFVTAAVVLQTTVFVSGRIYPFGYAPIPVIVVVLASSRYLEPETSVALGFTGGLLMDLLGGEWLGLWAGALTTVAFLGLRLVDSADDSNVSLALGVGALSVLGIGLFVLTGTLFGLQLLSRSNVALLIVVPSLYNVMIALPILAMTKRLMKGRQTPWSSI